MRGLFITFEGIDGCGKTTQIRRAAEALRAAGVDVVETREPGGTEVGNAVRELLMRPLTPPLVPEAELHLFAAGRAQHVRQVIAPALEAGRAVLCDRFTDATVAYQGYGRGMALERIHEVNRLATGGLQPDVTVLLDFAVEDAGNRIRWRTGEGEAPTRFDLESLAFHTRVRDGYLDLAALLPERFVVVDAAGEPDEVAARVAAGLEPKVASWRSRT